MKPALSPELIGRMLAIAIVSLLLWTLIICSIVGAVMIADGLAEIVVRETSR